MPLTGPFAIGGDGNRFGYYVSILQGGTIAARRFYERFFPSGTVFYSKERAIVELIVMCLNYMYFEPGEGER